MKVLNNTAETKESCNFRNENNSLPPPPLDRKCLNPKIIYEAQITLNQLNSKEKNYIETVETDFKHRFQTYKIIHKEMCSFQHN